MFTLGEARPGWAGWYLGGIVLALGAGVLLAWNPLVLAGVIGVAVMARFPGLAPHALIVGEGTMFLANMAFGSYTLATIAEQGAVAAALGAIFVRNQQLRPLAIVAVSIAVLTPWLLGGISSYGASQSITGLRLTTFPILAIALGLSLSRKALDRLLVTASVVLVVNAIAAWYEGRIGTDGLIRAGVQYGTQITQIGDGVLRAPGLMRNSFHLGLFSGAFIAVVALSTFVAGQRLNRFTYIVGLPAALAALLLSTSRTSLVLVVVAALLCVQMSDASTRLGRASRVFAALLLPALPVGVIVMGAGSATSFFQRLGVWGSFFQSKLDLLGHGLGSVGAASFSQFSDSTGAFIDNYWLSIAYQFGGIALLSVYLGVMVLLIAVVSRRITIPARKAMAAIVLSIAGASMLLEVWEYPGAMALLGLTFGHWWASAEDATADPDPVPAERPVLLPPEQSRYRHPGSLVPLAPVALRKGEV